MKTARLVVAAVLALACVSLVWGRASKSMVGEKLPPLNLQYLKGKPDIAGKPLILEFWATWCPPCRKSIPHLNDLYNKHKSKGLVVIGVSNEKRDVVEKFLKTTRMDYYPAVDANLAKTFGVTGIPHAVLVDKTGKIVWEGHPAQISEKELALILD
ncbi:MAG: TlpA family protein disulfide reductase [Verrucomicrobiae bacterium]|nr:TlpA family protein disulfide reductase [Verrucomicrobiae bacterium]